MYEVVFMGRWQSQNNWERTGIKALIILLSESDYRKVRSKGQTPAHCYKIE